MLLYHTTTPDAASRILAEGFRDSVDPASGRAGVWVSDYPTDDGVQGTGAVIVVTLPAQAVAEFELPGTFQTWDAQAQRWIPWGDGVPYRAFNVPASLVNGCPRTLEPIESMDAEKGSE